MQKTHYFNQITKDFTIDQYLHQLIGFYIEENSLEVTGSPFEMYITDPMKEPDQSKWETKVYFPIN